MIPKGETIPRFEWDYTEGATSDIPLVKTAANATAEFQADGLHLAGGSSTWSYGGFYIGSAVRQKFSAFPNVSISITYKDAIYNGQLDFYPFTNNGRPRIYYSGTAVYYSFGGNTKINNVSPTTSGTIKLLYSGTQFQVWRNGTSILNASGSRSGTVDSYVRASTGGSSSATCSAVITHILIQVEE